MKKCKDCKKIVKGTRCLSCFLKYKSKSMKIANIAKIPEVRKKLSEKMQGEGGTQNRNWKGGITNIKGYLYVYSPTHPNANNKKYYPLHRLIMEKHLGRILNLDETVHHKDENKLNNALENLELFPTRGAHRKIHTPLGKKIGAT